MTLTIVLGVEALGLASLAASWLLLRAAPRWPWLFWPLLLLGAFLLGGATFALITGGGGDR